MQMGQHDHPQKNGHSATTATIHSPSTIHHPVLPLLVVEIYTDKQDHI
jgi:hypothetical protein